jgi:hypothetical protein
MPLDQNIKTLKTEKIKKTERQKANTKENNQTLLTDFIRPKTESAIINKTKPKSLKVSNKETTRNKEIDQATSCNLEQELDRELDESLLKSLNLSEEKLKLKETNPDLFWEQIAEIIRENLSDTLDDNLQVCSF